VYYPGAIDSTRKIPVIQGMILEGQTPSVTLSWALGYKDQKQEFISGANVDVTDNLGNSVTLAETSGGKYIALSDEFKGIQGRIYTLHVELPDGNEYASTPVLLHNHPLIDSIYADPATRTAYTYNENNEPVPDEQVGLNVLGDLSANSDSVIYYRFNTKVLKEMLYTVELYTPQMYSIFLWETSVLDNNYSVDFTFAQNGRQVLREHPVGFLRYYYDVTLETESSTAPYTIAWVLIFNVYSISHDVYDYYNSLAQQLTSNGEIFAPLPSQIKSTVRCINDPANDVIGVFEASSLSTVYKAFGWVSLDEYMEKDLSFFPDLDHGGTVERIPPYFWINF
jgi:hypothetical protein